MVAGSCIIKAWTKSFSLTLLLAVTPLSKQQWNPSLPRWLVKTKCTRQEFYLTPKRFHQWTFCKMFWTIWEIQDFEIRSRFHRHFSRCPYWTLCHSDSFWNDGITPRAYLPNRPNPLQFKMISHSPDLYNEILKCQDLQPMSATGQNLRDNPVRFSFSRILRRVTSLISGSLWDSEQRSAHLV